MHSCTLFCTSILLRLWTKALLCLPASYIAGKMMLVRAMTLGWDLYFTGPQKDPLGQNDKTYDFVAMVPFQVRYSLKHLNKVNNKTKCESSKTN